MIISPIDTTTTANPINPKDFEYFPLIIIAIEYKKIAIMKSNRTIKEAIKWSSNLISNGHKAIVIIKGVLDKPRTNPILLNRLLYLFTNNM